VLNAIADTFPSEWERQQEQMQKVIRPGFGMIEVYLRMRLLAGPTHPEQGDTGTDRFGHFANKPASNVTQCAQED
jgi:hypothetical protein